MNPFLAFTLMCLAWGSTFVTAKIAVAEIPPIFLFGLRFVATAVLILLWFALTRFKLRITPIDRWRLVGLSVLNVLIGYGVGFWSIQFLPSGLAAVLNFSGVALSVLGFSLLLRQEQVNFAKLLGIGLGVVGLLLLFAPSLHIENRQQAVAMLAMMVGSMSASLAMVLVRPISRRYSPLEVTLTQFFPGSLMLIVLSLLVEPVSLQTLQSLAQPAIGLSFMHLVLVGSLMGMTLFYYLLSHWPTTRVSSYTFICPIIALVLGALLLHERISALELFASAVMLLGAALTLVAKA